MSKLRLTYGTPAHGWLPILLETPSGEQRDEGSDGYEHSLDDLVAGLVQLSAGSTHEEIEWYLEPEDWKWTFDVQGNKVLLTAEHPSRGTAKVRLSKRELLREMCRSLEALAADPAWAKEDAEATVWGAEFPHAELAKLRALLPAEESVLAQGFRLVGAFGLLCVIGVSVYGLVATLEPGDASSLFAWRLVFGGALVGALIFMRRLLASTRPRKTDS